MEGDNGLAAAILGACIGAGVGLAIKVAYSLSDPNAWRSTFPIHHGLLGLAIIPAGVLMDKSLVTGFGVGLAIQDIADFSKWDVGDMD